MEPAHRTIQPTTRVAFKPQWTPENAKRAEQYSPEVWKRFWPVIQEYLDSGLTQKRVVKYIKSLPEAVSAGFHPTRSQLERQVRMHREEQTEPSTMPSSSYSTQFIPCPLADSRMVANHQDPGLNGHIFIGRSPIPDDVYAFQPAQGGLTRMPSLTKSSTVDHSSEPETPGVVDVNMQLFSEELIDGGGVRSPHELLVGVAAGIDKSMESERCAGDQLLEIFDDAMDLVRNPQDALEQMQPHASKPFEEAAVHSTKSSTMTKSESSDENFERVAGFCRYPQLVQLRRLPEDALGLIRVQPFKPHRIWEYINTSPHVLRTEPELLFEEALQAGKAKQAGDKWKCLYFLNLVRARRLLSDKTFCVFMEQLIASDNRTANARQKLTAKTFLHCCDHCVKRVNTLLPRLMFAGPGSISYSTIEQKLCSPVHEQLTAPEADTV